MATSDEMKSQVGLKNLYFAKVTQDDATAYVAEAPLYLAPAAEATAAPSVNSETQYADDAAFDTLSSEGPTEIELTVTNIPPDTLAIITGRVFDAATGRFYDNGGTPPYVALQFESVKSNGKKRFYSYLKGRFGMPSEEFATKTDTPEFKTLKLPFTAIKTIYAFNLGSIVDGVKRVLGDEDTPSFSGANWYTQVQKPGTTAPAAMTLSSSTPTGGATGVAVAANIILNFSNPLEEGAEAGIVLMVSATHAVLPGTKTLSNGRKTVTIDPTSNLAAATAHVVSIGVKDVYGQTLNSSLLFTTN